MIDSSFNSLTLYGKRFFVERIRASVRKEENETKEIF